jgi:FkbM family methyltransferase
MYEPSLKRIQQVLGGHYTFAAVSDRDGEIELQMGSHHYWASTLPSDAPYWAGANRPGGIVKVRAATLDTLVQEFALKPPFLLKLDIQGGELEALRGGRKMLAETDTIICESEPVAFMSVCEFLKSQNFKVIDFTHMFRLNDGVLAEFYPVFLNNRVKYETVDPWTAGIASLVSQMESRRANILDRNAKILADLQAKQVPSRPG